MTEKELKKYNTYCKALERKQTEYDRLCNKDIPIIADKVSGTSSHFPYMPIHVQTEAYEPKEYERVQKKKTECEKDIKELTEKRDAIEDFISSIVDPETKMLAEYRAYENLSWTQIAEKMAAVNFCSDRTTYAKRLSKMLKESEQDTKK